MKLGSSDIGSVYIGSTAVNKIYIGSTEVWTSNSGLLADYPGAAAAYSLRLLQTTYTGDAIRVRRASDNAESDIGFVSGELDTSTLETFCSGTDGFVTTWYDQSSNGNDATQTTAANQPQIVSAGSTILENGKPSLSFDGSDWMVSSSAYPTQQYLSNFYLASSTGTNNRVLDTRGTGVTVQGWHHKFSNPIIQGDLTVIDNGVILIKTENFTRSGQKLVSVLAYGGSGTYINEYTNGSLAQNVNDGTSRDFNSGSNLYIATNVNGQNNQSFGGKLQEIVCYTSDQSSNRSGIETNINDFYTIY